VLEDAVEDSDDLEDAEAAEGDQGDAFRGFFAQQGDELGDEEERVAEKAETEEKCDGIFHGFTPWVRNSKYQIIH